MSLTVEPTGRSASAARSQATMPVEASSTIALGAWIDGGHLRACADAGTASRSAAVTAARSRRRRVTGARGSAGPG